MTHRHCGRIRAGLRQLMLGVFCFLFLIRLFSVLYLSYAYDSTPLTTTKLRKERDTEGDQEILLPRCAAINSPLSSRLSSSFYPCFSFNKTPSLTLPTPVLPRNLKTTSVNPSDMSCQPKNSLVLPPPCTCQNRSPSSLYIHFPYPFLLGILKFPRLLSRVS